MAVQAPHFKDIFQEFAACQQRSLRSGRPGKGLHPVGMLERLLSRYREGAECAVLREAGLDPYFPLGMLERTLFADVEGMRFFVNKRRPDLEQVLVDELKAWSSVFLRVRHDIRTCFNPETITCIPLDGGRHPLPLAQWCTLCGECCQIGGVPPLPPPQVRYPRHWESYLAGGAVANQQACPFLFQYFGEPRFFCSIHNIKPVACRDFDQEACRLRLGERGLHRTETVCS
jgi:hypothetical protein